MQVYINDGSSWGAELEDQDEPVLFADYQNSYDWYDYVEQAKITRYYPLNVTSAGWATLYIGFATDLPSDLSPYIVLDKNFDQKVATLKRISQLVPHETPLVIKAEQDRTRSSAHPSTRSTSATVASSPWAETATAPWDSSTTIP